MNCVTNKSIFDFDEDLTCLREKARKTTIEQVLFEKADSKFLLKIDELVLKLYEDGHIHLPFAYYSSYEFCRNLDLQNIDDAWSLIQQYCKNRYNNDFILPHYLFEVLFCIFPFPSVGLTIEKNIVVNRFNFVFDKDGLLLLNRPGIVLTKEGILYRDDWILIDNELPGGALSGGFMDHLIKHNSASDLASNFRVSIQKNLIISRHYHFPIITKAFIRGPKGISLDMLQNPNFPEFPAGTITEHRRVDENPLYSLYPLDRIEVMWSSRNKLKTVQIEEIIPISNDSKQIISNRYIHAIWSTELQKIIHFDGAIRKYDPIKYIDRLNSDMRKYNGKPYYKKVFRFDSKLDLDKWCSLVVRFFIHNELILEYLGGHNEI